MLVSVSRLVPVDRSPSSADVKVFYMNVDYERQSYYTETKYVGEGYLTPRYDFVSAIRHFII
jgi:hypothetical protein